MKRLTKWTEVAYRIGGGHKVALLRSAEAYDAYISTDAGKFKYKAHLWRVALFFKGSDTPHVVILCYNAEDARLMYREAKNHPPQYDPGWWIDTETTRAKLQQTDALAII